MLKDHRLTCTFHRVQPVGLFVFHQVDLAHVPLAQQAYLLEAARAHFNLLNLYRIGRVGTTEYTRTLKVGGWFAGQHSARYHQGIVIATRTSICAVVRGFCIRSGCDTPQLLIETLVPKEPRSECSALLLDRWRPNVASTTAIGATTTAIGTSTAAIGTATAAIEIGRAHV